MTPAYAKELSEENGIGHLPEPANDSDYEIDVSQTEFHKWAQRSFQAMGASFGIAQEASRAYVFLEAIGKKGLKSLLCELEHGEVGLGAKPKIVRLDGNFAWLDAGDGALAIAAIPALDIAAAHR